jgi:hypothetical protein
MECQKGMVKRPVMTPKNAAAVALGKRGGKARAKNLTAEQRSESARVASEARWAKEKSALKDLVDEIKKGTKRLEEKIAAKSRKAK